MEIAAFEGPSFDLARAGLSLTASPLQADILLVTGPGARNAAGPLRLAWEAMAPPRHVIAVGDCAAGDGLFAAGYAIADGGVGGIVPVDLVVRGAPPPPEAVLLAILTLVEAGVRS
jgi:Ni,Fe-hydrogenase III small subunit